MGEIKNRLIDPVFFRNFAKSSKVAVSVSGKNYASVTVPTDMIRPIPGGIHLRESASVQGRPLSLMSREQAYQFDRNTYLNYVMLLAGGDVAAGQALVRPKGNYKV